MFRRLVYLHVLLLACLPTQSLSHSLTHFSVPFDYRCFTLPLPARAAFISAVDWSEGWIQGLLAFHVCYFLAVVLTYKSYGAQVFLFLLGCALVKASEVGNTYLAANWETFSRQNYFDENGLFVACMWAGPLLFVLVLQAFNFIRMNANLLVKLKRRQLLERAKEGKKKK